MSDTPTPTPTPATLAPLRVCDTYEAELRQLRAELAAKQQYILELEHELVKWLPNYHADGASATAPTWDEPVEEADDAE